MCLDLKGEAFRFRRGRISLWVSLEVFLLMRMEDVDTLMDWPDQPKYLWIQWMITWASRIVAQPKIIRSSAKRRWENLGPLGPIWMPLRLDRFSSFRKSLERLSEPIINRKWERGSPCLNPLEYLKYPKLDPFSKMEKEAEDKQLEIQLVKEGRNPKCFRASKSRDH